jgi:hypothetical protein
MGRYGWAVLFVWGGLSLVGISAAARAGQVTVGLAVEKVQQLGPAYSGEAVALGVHIRNTGQTECRPCWVRIIGGGSAASAPLPRLGPGSATQVTVGGLLFPRPGKYPLSITVDAPREAVEFAGKRPSAVYELTVLDGPPPRRGAGR